MRQSPHRRWHAAWVVGASALLVPAAAQAECPLELVPADAPPGWKSAARAAADHLASSTSPDCSSVEIAVRPSGGALLTFLTTDGRRAVRALMSPEEIAPALDALLVTLPPEPARPEPAPVQASPSPSVAETPAAPVPNAGAAAPVAPSPEVHFIIGGSAGVRFGLEGAYASPAFALRPSGTFGAWELAGAVELDPSYTYLPGGEPPGFKLWSFVAAVQVGRRQAVGESAIGYGLGLGVASVREEAEGSDGTRNAADFAQPRAALYGRFIAPRRATVRATFDLGFDVALAIFRQKSLRNELPDLPRWGLLLTAGIETSAL